MRVDKLKLILHAHPQFQPSVIMYEFDKICEGVVLVQFHSTWPSSAKHTKHARNRSQCAKHYKMVVLRRLFSNRDNIIVRLATQKNVDLT